MDKVYTEYKKSVMNKSAYLKDIDVGGTDSVGIIRKEVDLTNNEKRYLLAVERGDVPTTRQILEQFKVNHININCVDPLGRTAVLIAIENENIEMIELLINHGIEIGDALLHAINEENVEAVEMILHYEISTKGEEALNNPRPSTSFSADITPIILAGHRDNYEIIKLLLDLGCRITKPHDIRCNCKQCEAGNDDDSLRHSRSRINSYKALASPSLISLSSKDPILTAFELCADLRRLSKLENEFKIDYEKLSLKCQEFAVDLLEQTRGSSELHVILNHDTNSTADENYTERQRLARLKVAIKYKQKKFVSHPNCQQLLASLWYEGLPGFRRKNVVAKICIIQAIGLMFPILSIFYLLIPTCFLGRLIRKPFIKFIIHSASYITFLFLLILVSQRVEFISDNTARRYSDGTKVELRGESATLVEWMILAYVAGMIWAEIKQIWYEGFREYIQDMWNILDFATNTLYIATVTMRLLAYLQIHLVEEDKLYPHDLERKEWDAYDPNLIAEAMFAAANIFSSLKLIYIFTVNPHLGPLQISLGRMIMDILRFMMIYFLVLFSFGCGLTHLYWYYAHLRAQECQNNIVESCDRKYRSFANLFEIIQSLYWSMFGLVDLEHAELTEFNHDFTELIGKLMFGTYSFIAFIVLLNMLIAMMSNSYQIIYMSSDEEWKFARSKLWISYFEDSGTLPPPFNIIPSPKIFYYLLLWIKKIVLSCSPRQKRNRWQSIKKVMKKINEKEIRYQAVMRDLIKRYIMTKQHNREKGENITEDDINELKQDVSSFRYELLEILRNNGMKTTNSCQLKPTNRRRLSKKRSRINVDRMTRSMSMEPLLEHTSKQEERKTQLPSIGHADLESSKSLGELEQKPSNKVNGQLGQKSGEHNEENTSLVEMRQKVDEGLGESFDGMTDIVHDNDQFQDDIARRVTFM